MDHVELGKVVTGDGRILYVLGDRHGVQLFDPARDFEQVVAVDMKDIYADPYFDEDIEEWVDDFDYDEDIGNIEILETISSTAQEYLGIEYDDNGELKISLELVRPAQKEAQKVFKRIM